MQETMTAELLAQLLRDAEMAHGEYERKLGHSDPDWPSWYAQFILEHVPEAHWE